MLRAGMPIGGNPILSNPTDGFHLQKKVDGVFVDKLAMDMNGNVTIAGELVSVSDVAGWVNDEDSSYGLHKTTETNFARLGGSQYAFSAGNEATGTSFTVDYDGNFQANSATIDGKIIGKSGQIGGFSIGADGSLMGASLLKVGAMTLSGTTINGFRLSRDNMLLGTPGAGTYMLGINSSNQFVLFDISVAPGGADGHTHELSAFSAGGGSGNSVSVIQITSSGNGLTMRQFPSTGSASVGTCYTNEVYAVSSTDTSDGYTWVYTGAKYTYNSGTGKWTASYPGSGWVRQTNSSKTDTYYYFTSIIV